MSIEFVDPETTPIVLTDHAVLRMRQRQVNLNQIYEVLRLYHTSRPAPRLDSTAQPVDIYIGDVESRTLKIYVERDSKPIKIKTVAVED